jgi:hypothetical protein
MEPAAPVDQSWDRTVLPGIWLVTDQCLIDVAKPGSSENFAGRDCSMLPL